MEPYTITQIRIKNFKGITQEVVITDIRKCNSLIGLYETLKKDLAHAIIYCMGATANQLQVDNIFDVQSSQNSPCYVILYLNSRNREDKKFERRIFGQETFHVNGETMGIAEYYENLRNVNIDMSKQFNFYDARNRSFFWHVQTTVRNAFIAKMNGMAEQIVSCNDLCNERKHVQIHIERTEKEIDHLKQKVLKMREHLPRFISNWNRELFSSIASLLRLDEEKRREKIRILNVSRDKFREITIRNDELLEQIQNAERNLNEGNGANRNFLQELQEDAFQPYNNQTIQSLKSRAFLLKSKIEVNTLRTSDGELRLRDLETYKRSIESHLQFMNTPLDQQDSRLITEDALLKFYQIAHSADELALDILSLRLKNLELYFSIIDNNKLDVEYIDTIFPQLCLSLAAETKLDNARIVFNEMKSAFNRNIDPNTTLDSTSSPEILGKLIPETKGFLLTSVFQPSDPEHQCMIDSILYNSKYTIVLYDDDKQAIYNMLQKKCPGIFLNVHFVVHSALPQPVQNFAIPATHWMNYCQPNENLDQELFQFMANQKNILRVESHDDVRNEFWRHTRKYVISADGQLTYTRLMNVDVLEYFKPGKKPKNMEIANSNVKKMLDANEKCSEIFASQFEEELVPPNDESIRDEDELQQEMETLKQEIQQAKEHRKMQMERWRANLDAPYPVPEPPDFTERRIIEQRKLDDVNGKILAIQDEIATRQAANRNLTTQVTNIENCIGIKNRMKVNETSCAIHSKTVKEKRRIYEENEEGLRKLNEQITRAKNFLEKLKQSTMRNVAYLVYNTTRQEPEHAHLADEILQLCNVEEGIDPEKIQLHVPDSFRNNREVATRDYYGKIHDADISINARQVSITTAKQNYNEISEHIFHREFALQNQCRQLNTGISDNLAILLQQMYPEFKYQIRFNFDYKDENERMIIVHENGQEIQIQNLITTDQQIIHWMLFAAFHQYSNSPILFVDFRDNLDIITKIDPIINWITNKSQVFCYSSHGQLCTLSTFANMQIAVNRMDEEFPPCIVWRPETIPEEMEE